MKRTWTLLGIGLALALPLTACTRDKAPDVTPTPSPVVTSQPSTCLLYTSPSLRDRSLSRMPSSA